MIKKQDARLIPFTVESVVEKGKTVPEGISMIGASETWIDGNFGEGIIVAVLDTGCQKDHPDLQSRIIDGRNFTEDFSGNPNNFSDTNGHGTHVAGTIAADGTQLYGAAPAAQLLICKVLNGAGSGSYEGIISGIEYAINWRGTNGEKVRIINMSLGGSDDLPELHAAIKKAVDANILVVCAAGNEGDGKEETNEYAYPGAYNEVIQIGAVDYKKQLASFSNNNNEVDAVAPGVDILSTYPGSRYARFSGTSMASPHVSGALALLILKMEREFNRPLSEAEMYAQLVKHTEDLHYKKSSVGNGLVRLDIVDKMNALKMCVESLNV